MEGYGPRREVLEPKYVIGFDNESDGRSREAGEYVVKEAEDMAVDQGDEGFRRAPKSKWKKRHEKKAAMKMLDFKIPMQTGNPG